MSWHCVRLLDVEILTADRLSYASVTYLNNIEPIVTTQRNLGDVMEK